MKSAQETKHSKTTQTASETSLTQEDLKVLKAPFPRENLGVKVQSVSKDRTRAMLVLYLQHTDVQDRLEQVDPAWTCEVLSEERSGDTVYVRTRMTVKGVSRENVGEGGDPKAAYSDALKRCAMLFGVGRYLYDSITVWAEYNESKDRYRTWSVADYERAASASGKQAAAQASLDGTETDGTETDGTETQERPGLTTEKPQKTVTKKPPEKAVATSASTTATSTPPSASRSRDQLNRILMQLYRPFLSKFPDTRFVDLLQSRYGVAETRLMTVEQIEDLVQHLEQRLASAA